VHENEIRRADPREGFDRQEPEAGPIVGFAVGSVILLIITIVALQVYFNKIWEEAVYEKVLAPPSGQLIELHNREDWNQTHYGYSDKASGTVRIPLDRATELFMEEAKAGKLFYPAKNTVPKKEEPVAAAAPAAGAEAPAGEKK